MSENFNPNERSVLTSFYASVCKPIGVNDGGNKALFYAQSGDNANVVCQFSTSYYWHQTVNVNVYLIKNRDGELMSENGVFPLVASFLGRIEHPTHKNSDSGQMAVFYADAGENGDIVSQFLQDQYVDALVYVELRGAVYISNPDIFEAESQREIQANHRFNLSLAEHRQYEKNKDKYVSLNEMFQDFALNSHRVQKLIEQEVTLGNHMDFETYIKTEWLKPDIVNLGIDNHCYHSNRCYNPVKHVFRKVANNPYSLVCLCDEHQHDHISDDMVIQTNLEAKSNLNKRRWMWRYFINRYAISEKHQPDSRLLYAWLCEHDLMDLVTKPFLKQIQKMEQL